MQSYFFIPANRLHKIESIQELNIDEIIIDLEDAIKSSERELYLDKLKSESINRDFFVRVPIYTIQNKLDTSFLKELMSFGYKNFIFPKLQKIQDFDEIKYLIPSLNKIILLVETPLFLTQVPKVLDQYSDMIYGIGLGSHDLMNMIGGEHSLNNLEFYRNFILLHAKSYNVIAFDIASMELTDEQELKHEVLDGFKKGFEAKFYIHPWQIQIKNEIEFYSESDFLWAKKVYSEYLKVENPEEFNPIIVDGEIIEKPHLNKVFTILKYFKNDTK